MACLAFQSSAVKCMPRSMKFKLCLETARLPFTLVSGIHKANKVHWSDEILSDHEEQLLPVLDGGQAHACRD